jgi:hypothetical protein
MLDRKWVVQRGQIVSKSQHVFLPQMHPKGDATKLDDIPTAPPNRNHILLPRRRILFRVRRPDDNPQTWIGSVKDASGKKNPDEQDNCHPATPTSARRLGGVSIRARHPRNLSLIELQATFRTARIPLPLQVMPTLPAVKPRPLQNPSPLKEKEIRNHHAAHHQQDELQVQVSRDSDNSRSRRLQPARSHP